VERYGDYVRYRPPFKSTTVLLWFGPLLLLGIGVAVLYFNILRRKKVITETPLSKEEQRRAEALLKKDESGDSQA
ncbi:MAG TPA: cytochrome c-type biogenesis protein CcmH, partial [Candidatus Tenderia sp.]|nr:cytochrome c-type biogenesis protein CcmH [Candidatus Tenderia sp.]